MDPSLPCQDYSRTGLKMSCLTWTICTLHDKTTTTGLLFLCIFSLNVAKPSSILLFSSLSTMRKPREINWIERSNKHILRTDLMKHLNLFNMEAGSYLLAGFCGRGKCLLTFQMLVRVLKKQTSISVLINLKMKKWPQIKGHSVTK